MINVGVFGAAGRMGTLLCNAILMSEDLDLAAAIERKGHAAIGNVVSPAPGFVLPEGKVSVEITSIIDTERLNMLDVALEFTGSAEDAICYAYACSQADTALVRGTTGLSPEMEKLFEHNARSIPCVRAPNYAVGVNLLFRLVEEAARILGDEYDVEIVEAHHRFKKDTPSGTAKWLGEAAARGLKRNLEEVAVYGRKGMVGERTKQEIGIHAIRAGDIVGEHTVLFATTGERVELVSKITSRDAFVAGALRAVRWVVDQPAGLYDMGDVLGLK